MRLEKASQPLADRHRAILVEGAVVAEGGEVELERLRLHQPGVGHVVDDEMREVGLAGDGAQARELGRREAGGVVRVGMRVRYAVEHGRIGARGDLGALAEQAGF
jgi:hypothetical protein